MTSPSSPAGRGPTPRAIGVYNVDAIKIEGNYIATQGVAITASLQTNLSRIGDNYIDAGCLTAISVSGTNSGTGPRVEQNYIINYALGVSSGAGDHLRVQTTSLRMPADTSPMRSSRVPTGR
jgi:hypothetical protein